MSFHKKLGFRIGLIVAISIFVIEAIIGVFTMRGEREALLQKESDTLGATLAALQGDISRSIQRQKFESLSTTLFEVSRHFNAYAYTLLDAKGKILIQELLSPDYQVKEKDLRGRMSWSVVNRRDSVERVQTASGEVWRYLIPVYDSDRNLLGGLALETPVSGVDPQVRSYLLRTVGLVLIIALFVTATVTPILFHFVVKPINVMRGELENLSKGEADLTFQIQVKTRDEIGDMAHWFNSFIGRIRAMVLRVLEHSGHLSEQVQTLTHSTAEVAAMSGDVTTTIQQIAKGAEEQAVKIAEVNQLMQDVQETMKEVEKKARETSGAADKASQTAKVSGRMARVTIDKMVELSGLILKNSEMVGHLGTKSHEVGRVVELISAIAEQTNLLSLNAAIEAARAGEQGRGFAVVAEEIRALADGSSKAVQEITTLVQEMQDETQGVVGSMEKSSREAQAGKDGIRQMEGSLDEIVAVIENVVEHTKSISEMINAQSQRFTKIVNSIQDINAVSEESAASTEEVSASTQEQSASMEQVNATFRELSAMSVELKSMVDKFKIR